MRSDKGGSLRQRRRARKRAALSLASPMSAGSRRDGHPRTGGPASPDRGRSKGIARDGSRRPKDLLMRDSRARRTGARPGALRYEAFAVDRALRRFEALGVERLDRVGGRATSRSGSSCGLEVGENVVGERPRVAASGRPTPTRRRRKSGVPRCCATERRPLWPARPPPMPGLQTARSAGRSRRGRRAPSRARA